MNSINKQDHDQVINDDTKLDKLLDGYPQEDQNKENFNILTENNLNNRNAKLRIQSKLSEKNVVSQLNDDCDKNKKENLTKEKLFKLFVEICQDSGVYIISSLSFFLIQTINMLFLGHVDSINNIKYLCAAQIATIYINTMGFTFCMGAMHAFDKLGAPAFLKKDFELFYDMFQSSKIFSILIFLIFMLPICFCSKYILAVLGFGPEMVDLTWVYIRIQIISVTLNLLHLIHGKLLQIIGQGILLMGIYMITIVIHTMACVILVINFDLGLNGVAIASVISSTFAFLSTGISAIYFNPFKCNKKPIIGFDTDCLNTSKFYIYAKFGTISGLHNLLHEIAFDYIVVMSYFLDDISLTTNAILYNYVNLQFHVILGYAVPVARSLHDYLINNELQKAVIFIKGIGVLAALNCCGLCLLNFTFRHWISYIYINNESVALNVVYFINVYSFFIFFDWTCSITHFILNGLNKLMTDYFSNLSLILLVLPLGTLMSFTFKFGFIGFWYAIFLNFVVFSLVQSIYLVSLVVSLQSGQSQIANDMKHMIDDEDIFFK